MLLKEDAFLNKNPTEEGAHEKCSSWDWVLLGKISNIQFTFFEEDGVLQNSKCIDDALILTDLR